MRKKFEFHCTECSKYFDFKLNVSLNGNYRIHCPMCGHVHYRKVVKGQITDVRFPDNHTSILIEDIRPMKSSCRDYSIEVKDDTSPELSGFMRRFWKEKVEKVLQ